MTKQAILDALYRFAEQRPRMEPANYGDYRSYRSESRSVTRDLEQARQLIRYCELSSVSAEAILQASRGAYSGRLSINIRDDGAIVIDYCVGQYFPTEFRRAVCAVCASALWHHYRDDYAKSAKPSESPGDAIRRNFRRNYGRTLQQRWFN